MPASLRNISIGRAPPSLVGSRHDPKPGARGPEPLRWAQLNDTMFVAKSQAVLPPSNAALLGTLGFMTDDTGRPDHAPKQSMVLLDELAKRPRELTPEGTTPLQMHAFLGVAMAKHREGQLVEAEQK